MNGLPRDSAAGGIRVHRIRTLRKAADRTNVWEMAIFLASALWSAGRLAKAGKIEGVVTFFTIPCGPVGWLLNRLQGLPYIVSLRGGDVPGHVREIVNMHRLVTPLRRLALRGACAVVANAPGLARLSERMDPVPVRVIPNGVDSTLFRPGEAGERAGEGEFRILFVGRLHELKNIDLLFKAAAALSGEGVPVRIELVGDGPQRRELEALAQTLGIADRITWHGWQTKEQVATHYRTTACFVNPSRYEGMPNTVLEAMASGLPVVASDVGGNNDLVIHGETGYLFDLADPDTLRRRLKSLADDAGLRRRMGARGRELVVSNYSWLSIAERYVDLLGVRVR
jgi:glycosyltransferase involved in cell wall biosynthesis